MTDPTTRRHLGEQLILGAAFVAAGSAAGIWLAPALAVVIGLTVVFRLCWLDDNITHDLIPSDRMPTAYRNDQKRRAALFGEQEDGTACPRLLASRLRIQSHGWNAFFWGLVAGGVMIHVPFGVGLSLLAGFGAIALAMRAAERFARAQAVVLSGRPLSEGQLAPRGALARFGLSHHEGE